MSIFSGDRYSVRKVFLEERGKASSQPVVVTFPHAGGPNVDQKAAFGEVFLKKAGFDAYHILISKIDWFQHQEFFDLIAAIRNDIPPERPVVAYGASMGGYGALLASKQLDAARVLSVVPQFSIDRGVVPWERRWKEHAEFIGDFTHDVAGEISETAEIYSVHDPRNIDDRQMALYPECPNWTQFRIPFSGHTPLIVLQQAGVLGEFVTAIVRGDVDAQHWRARLLSSRRSTRSYWRVIATHAVRRRRMDFARYALERLEMLGGTAAEIAAVNGAIDRVLDSDERRAQLFGNPAARVDIPADEAPQPRLP